jgi:hypothetical protein
MERTSIDARIDAVNARPFLLEVALLPLVSSVID